MVRSIHSCDLRVLGNREVGLHHHCWERDPVGGFDASAAAWRSRAA